MKEPRQKLARLNQFMPRPSRELQAFGKFLAERLGQRDIVPLGFVLGAELALYDIKGKWLGVPAYDLIGGLYRDKIPLYWSHFASYRGAYRSISTICTLPWFGTLVK